MIKMLRDSDQKIFDVQEDDVAKLDGKGFRKYEEPSVSVPSKKKTKKKEVERGIDL